MIFEALRRRVARYLGPRATSVSPKFDPDAAIDEILKSLRARGLIPPSTEVRVLQEPRHPGLMPPGAEMPWPQWRALESEIAAPEGWSACRFPTWRPGERDGEEAGICAFVFGITRGAFGIWHSPFPVCVTDDDGMFTEQREDVLAAVTHLPSGLGMGIFADRASAVASCNAAVGLGIDWRQIAPTSPAGQRDWIESVSRLKQARAFAGIDICRNRHAHVGTPEGRQVPIWEQRADAMAAGRPEKLS